MRYQTADLLNWPKEWHRAFDLVVESMTLQALPDPPRADAIARLSGLVAPGGTLIVIARACEPGQAIDGPPWALTRAEIDAVADDDLEPVRIEDVIDPEMPWPRRWRAEFRRPRGTMSPASHRKPANRNKAPEGLRGRDASKPEGEVDSRIHAAPQASQTPPHPSARRHSGGQVRLH